MSTGGWDNVNGHPVHCSNERQPNHLLLLLRVVVGRPVHGAAVLRLVRQRPLELLQQKVREAMRCGTVYRVTHQISDLGWVYLYRVTIQVV